MECELNIDYRVIDPLLPDQQNDGEYISTTTRDISGGGLCIKTEEMLDKGAYIDAILALERKMRFVGCVARSIKTRDKGKIIFETGIEFKHIENKDREKIVSYVFETQRDKLKKGWMKT